MKLVFTIGKIAVLAAVSLVFFGTSVLGQGAVRGREGDGRPVLKLRELTGYGPRAILKSPDSGASRRSASREWVELGVQYDTQPDWIDEVSLSYYVLLRNPRNNPELALIKGTVGYLDVARGASHLGVAYVRPAALARYGEVAAVAVEVRIKGEIIDVLSIGRLAPSKPLPSDWWKSPNLIAKDGYIVDKSRTPFALVNFDEYEALK